MERLTFAPFGQAGFPRSVSSEEFRIGANHQPSLILPAACCFLQPEAEPPLAEPAGFCHLLPEHSTALCQTSNFSKPNIC